MRCAGRLVLLGITLCICGPADRAKAYLEVPAPLPNGPIKGLEVHEWGVLRVHNDIDMANADLRAIWKGLPPFIYGQLDGRQLPKHWQNIEIVDRPILFFHAPQPLAMEVKVDFPGGFPMVWWPGTEAPAVQFGRVVGIPPKERLARSLHWRIHLRQPPNNYRRAKGLPEVTSSHWVQTLRGVKTDDVFAQVGERGFGYEREKFIYYDGLLPRGLWVEISVAKNQVSVRNRARHPVFDLTVVDRRTPGQIQVARLDRLDPRAETKAVKFTAADRRTWPDSAMRTLTNQLTTAGLHADEARSLVELWKQDLLLTDGLTVFYRLPQPAYDRLLPLHVRPRPEKLVRVGLVYHPHCEPDLAEKVAALARDLASPRYQTRREAEKRLRGLGRAAFVHLARLRRQVPDVEVRKRLDRLLREYDVRAVLP